MNPQLVRACVTCLCCLAVSCGVAGPAPVDQTAALPASLPAPTPVAPPAEKKEVDHFAHLRPEHREIVREWLASEPRLRPAVHEVDSWIFSEEWKKDFDGNHKFLRETVGEGGYQYYAVGDMNGDRKADFALLLAETGKPAGEEAADTFVLAIFNAPFQKGRKPAYYEKDLHGITNSYITYNRDSKKRLFLGKFESDVYCATYYPRKETYYYKDCMD